MSKKKLPTKYKPHSSSHLPTAIVAGAAGFIGSHLCENLIHQNCKVIAIDNWTTGKKENIEDLLKKDNFIFLEHDLNKPLKSPVPKVDYIFHLAGVESYINGLDVSLETLLVNSLGTKELLEIAKQQNSKYLLASTTDIFQGFLSSTNLNKYFGDTHQKEEAYSHYEAKRFSEALTFEYVNRYNLDARIVRLGNVYGPKMDLKTGNDIAKLFLNLKQGTNLKIYSQGLNQLYPTYISDVVYGLTKAMFSQSSINNIYTLINPQKTTVLNFAYTLKELIKKQGLKIKFVSGDKEIISPTISASAIKSQSSLGWEPKTDLKKGIQKTLNWLTKDMPNLKAPSFKKENIKEKEKVYTAGELGILPAKTPKTISSKPSLKKITLPKITLPKISLTPKLKFKKFKISLKTKLIILGLFGLFFSILIPPILMGGFAYQGVNSLKKASQITDINQLDKLTKLADSATSNFTKSRKLLRKSHFTAKILGLKNTADNLDRLLYIGTKLSQGALYLAKAGESGTFLTGIIFHHQDGNISEALKRIQLYLDQSYQELSFVESELQSGKQLNLDLTTDISQKFITLTKELPLLRKKINQVRNILPLIPSFIATDTKKSYLLLFQNSSEIRPTGGFIGSYGLLTFEQGKLLDFSVEDIYSADGQLKGFVKPPLPIKEFLGQSTWFFRDSNWDPDFTISAQRAEWFLNKTTGRNVDGVIAVNLPMVKELLKVTGPINLPDYNEEITATNLFERAEYRSEIDFFPGSTQKKDFLGALSREIFEKLRQSSASDILKFAQSFESSLTQKQLLVYLHDPQSQKLLLEQNWTGSIFDPHLIPKDNQPLTTDYSYLVEANLGINKANYFLKRNIRQQLTILKNKEILAITTITYDNQSPADAWPGGIYRSYLRDYIPQDSKLISVKIGDSKLNINNDIDVKTVNNKTILGFPILVPVKNTLNVEITYRLPQKLIFKNNQARLAIIIPKQPGIINDPVEAIINYPSFLTVVSIKPQALSSPQVVTFKSDMTTDNVFTVDFVER
ncbi:MAG: DUF4012 domain-containing protein [Patescibacteria group bacterium]|nr:DUF4012 domain-containing protein [Patescibacteria group bacterium]